MQDERATKFVSLSSAIQDFNLPQMYTQKNIISFPKGSEALNLESVIKVKYIDEKYTKMMYKIYVNIKLDKYYAYFEEHFTYLPLEHNFP